MPGVEKITPSITDGTSAQHHMDTVPKNVRSKIMTAVKPFGNKTTEVAMGQLLSGHKLRGYRKHWPIAGKPDFAWPRLKIALFVDGCFWHGCPKCKRVPASNVEFWTDRIQGNRKRDRRVAAALRKKGWVVIRVWECSLKQERTIRRIRRALDARRGELLS